jgi:hypothetical protein
MKKLATIYILLPVLLIMLFPGCLKKEVIDVPEPISPIIDEVVISTSTEENMPVWPEQIYTEEDYAGWKTYVNEKLGYKIQYPADWTINSCDEGCTSKEVIINPPDAEMFTSYISISLESRNIEGIRSVYLNPDYYDGRPDTESEIIFSGLKSFNYINGIVKNARSIFIENYTNNKMFLVSAEKDNNPKVLQILASFEFIN